MIFKSRWRDTSGLSSTSSTVMVLPLIIRRPAGRIATQLWRSGTLCSHRAAQPYGRSRIVARSRGPMSGPPLAFPRLDSSAAIGCSVRVFHKGVNYAALGRSILCHCHHRSGVRIQRNCRERKRDCQNPVCRLPGYSRDLVTSGSSHNIVFCICARPDAETRDLRRAHHALSRRRGANERVNPPRGPR